MSFIVYGGVSGEAVMGGDGNGIVQEGENRCAYTRIHFSFSLHSCREARRSAAFSSKESPCELHHLGLRSSAGAAK